MNEQVENKRKEKTEVSDDRALEILKDATVGESAFKRNRVATKFVPRTILYAVTNEYKPGVYTEEIRTYVRAREYVSEAKWEKALEIEKKFAKLNKQYTESLKAKKLPTSYKEPANPLKATIIEGVSR